MSKILHRKNKTEPRNQVKEHFCSVKYKDIEKSAVAYHFWITQHKVENEAKLLKQAEKLCNSQFGKEKKTETSFSALIYQMKKI